VELWTPEGYPYLLVGWPDEEYGWDRDAYADYVVDTEGELVPFSTYEEWLADKHAKNPDREELGFCPTECATCGEKHGERYAVTAYPLHTLDDYVPLRVCDSCVHYIVCGEPLD
jgi:hypothetical protein